MQISIEGASLLATLFPVALLIIVVEARAAGAPPRGHQWRRGDGAKSYWKWVVGRRNSWESWNAIGTTATLVGTLVCVVHVCMLAPLQGAWAAYVIATGVQAFVAVFLAANRLLLALSRQGDSSSG